MLSPFRISPTDFTDLLRFMAFKISDSHYTKTIQFQDINYQLSQNEDKTAIFEGWCDFLLSLIHI